MKDISKVFDSIALFLGLFKPKQKTIYLGGTISLYSYRDDVKKFVENNNIEMILIDPFNNNDFDANIKNDDDVLKAIKKIRNYDEIGDIVSRDLYLIQSCTAVVAYIEKITTGTMMELVYARILGKKVYVINPQNDMWNDIWLSYHTNKFFTTIEDCFNYINKIK